MAAMSSEGGRCTFDAGALEEALKKRGTDDRRVQVILLDLPRGWMCGREAYRGGSRCIFHAESKDPKEFAESFSKEMKRMDKEEDEFDFRGFTFPPQPFSLKDHWTGALAKPVFFTGAFFQGVANLDGAIFQGQASFVGATFQGQASFVGATFQGEASFGGATFQGEASFGGATFQGQALFGRATFQEASFNMATFQGSASFVRATFQEAWFGRATFQEALFDGAKFGREASFQGGQFVGTASFNHATFEGAALFVNRRFMGMADFSHASFQEQAVFLKPEESVDEDHLMMFFMTIFKSPRITRIEGYLLSRTSFMGTDIRDILLIPDSKEGEGKILDHALLEEQSTRGGVGAQAGRDRNTRQVTGTQEREAPVSSPQSESEPPQGSSGGSAGEDPPKQMAMVMLRDYLSREAVVVEYKRIRKCLEENRMFTESAELFVTEMKLSRERLSWSWRNFFERLIHRLYESLSRYGESVSRPIIFAPIYIALISIVLLGYNALFPFPSNETLTISLDGFLRVAGEVSAVFMQVKSFKDLVVLENAPTIFEILTRVASIIFLGTLVIALRRRLERK